MQSSFFYVLSYYHVSLRSEFCVVMSVTIPPLKRCWVRCLYYGSRLIHLICLCFPIVVSNTYCVLFLFYFSSSCVTCDASFSGLFIFDCTFRILQRLFPGEQNVQCIPPFNIVIYYFTLYSFMKPLIMKKSYAYMAVNIDYWYFSFIFIYFRSFHSKALLYNYPMKSRGATQGPLWFT